MPHAPKGKGFRGRERDSGAGLPLTLTTTGIAGLDAQLGGGVPRGTTLLLMAEPGNAISLFSEQFASGGMDSGDQVFYYEFDRPAGRITSSVTGLSHSLNDGAKRLRIFDGYAAQFGKNAVPKADEGNVSLFPRQDVFNNILRQVQQVGGRESYRLVLESLTTVTTPETEAHVLEFMKRLVFLGSELGGVQLISVVRGVHSPVFETKLKHIVSGVLELGTERKGFGLYNYLLVSKLLNVSDPVRLLLFKETDKGLWLESTKRVF